MGHFSGRPKCEIAFCCVVIFSNQVGQCPSASVTSSEDPCSSVEDGHLLAPSPLLQDLDMEKITHYLQRSRP